MTVGEALALYENKIAPVKLSDDFCAKYKMYDNSGIIIDCGKEVTGVLFTLDLSEAAVKLATERGFNLIITHHPAIYGGVSRIDTVNVPQSRAIADCIKNDVSVISMHLNSDAAPEGIDYYLMRGLGGKAGKTLCNIEGGAYGRVYDIEKTTLAKLAARAAETFRSPRIIYFGEADGQIKKAASFCGAGCDDDTVAFAKAQGADLFVSSDLKHHQIADLVESGIAVLQLTHYCAESYGFEKIYQELKRHLNVPSSFFFDGRFA